MQIYATKGHMRNKRFLKLILIIGTLICADISCKTAQEAVKNYEECEKDINCHRNLHYIGNNTQSAVSTAVTAIPLTSPLGGYIGAVLGSLASFAYGVLAGQKLRKQA